MLEIWDMWKIESLLSKSITRKRWNVPAVKKLKSTVKSSAFNDLSLSSTFLVNCLAMRLDTPGYMDVERERDEAHLQ